MLTTLDGTRILDFGLYFAGPYASRLLADLGADVVKLEPLEGDTLRPTTRPFNAAQRGKRSIAVDLKHPDGREVAHRLVRWADVVTHNLRPGVAERLAMDYQSLCAINPEVVYAYAPGWGSSGPDAQLPGFAPLFSGYVGLHHEAAGKGNVPVAPIGNEDNGNGLLGAFAILLALYHRRRTGRGQYLEHPQLNATLLMALHLMRAPDGSVVGSTDLDHERRGSDPLDRLYATADGWIVVCARTDAEFARLGSVGGFAGVGADAWFGASADRRQHGEELVAALSAIFVVETTEHWQKALGAADVPHEVPAGPDAWHRILGDPRHREDGRVEAYDHPRWGETSDIAVMLRLSGASRRPGRPSPEVGEHTDEILAGLGYDDEAVSDLRGRGVVR